MAAWSRFPSDASRLRLRTRTFIRWTVDEIPTNTAVTIPIQEAVSKDPDMGREAPINTIPEIPSSTVRPTPNGVVTRARLFNSAETTATPPKRKRRTSGKNSLTEARRPWPCPPFRGALRPRGPQARARPTRFHTELRPIWPPLELSQTPHRGQRPACHTVVEEPKYPRHDTPS